jgi:hypothetical protein
MSEMDYPRAFVSFPRIAGSGNEIADARAFSEARSQHKGPGDEVAVSQFNHAMDVYNTLFMLRRMKTNETLVCQIKIVLDTSKAERGKFPHKQAHYKFITSVGTKLHFN